MTKFTKSAKINMVFVVFGIFVNLQLVGCGGKDEGITVSKDEVVGRWLKLNTQEYWLYNTDYSGAMWDAGEGFSEDFPSYTFEWSVSGDRLTHVVRGEEIDVPITRIYTITEMSDTRMVREEELATYTLFKV